MENKEQTMEVIPIYVEELDWILKDVILRGNRAWEIYQSAYFAQPSCKNLMGEDYLNCVYEKINCAYEKVLENGYKL